MCQSEKISFIDKSIVSSGTITNYYWIFGDGGSSNLQNPDHKYLAPGIYNASLVITTDNGCIDTIAKPVEVYPMPVAVISSRNSCIDAAVQFTDSSTNSTCGISNWQWNFGDATTSAIQNPSHLYSTPGTYAVTLIVSSGFGCEDTLIKNVDVYPQPTPDFIANPVCQSDLIYFIDKSIVSSGNITNYYWTFGGN